MSWSKVREAQLAAQQQALLGDTGDTNDSAFKEWTRKMMNRKHGLTGDGQMLYPDAADDAAAGRSPAIDPDPEPIAQAGKQRYFDGEWQKTPGGWKVLQRNIRYE